VTERPDIMRYINAANTRIRDVSFNAEWTYALRGLRFGEVYLPPLSRDSVGAFWRVQRLPWLNARDLITVTEGGWVRGTRMGG